MSHSADTRAAGLVSLQMTGRALISLKVNDANAMSASFAPGCLSPLALFAERQPYVAAGARILTITMKSVLLLHDDLDQAGPPMVYCACELRLYRKKSPTARSLLPACGSFDGWIRSIARLGDCIERADQSRQAIGLIHEPGKWHQRLTIPQASAVRPSILWAVNTSQAAR